MLQFHVYPGGTRRIVTFSYDDGGPNDVRLIALFNKYGVKGTFHLNAKKVLAMNEEERAAYAKRYLGHEISCHTVNHGWLTRMPASSLIGEVFDDRKVLEGIAGYPVIGMSYPSGDYNDKVISGLAACGIVYSRTTRATMGFAFPDDWLAWHPTCHHKDADQVIPSYLERLDSEWGNPLLYIWGHAHEFRSEEDWAKMEQTVASIANLKQVWYATNREIYDYIEATRRAVVSADETMICNPSSIDIWVERDKRDVIMIPAGQTVKLK